MNYIDDIIEQETAYLKDYMEAETGSPEELEYWNKWLAVRDLRKYLEEKYSDEKKED